MRSAVWVFVSLVVLHGETFTQETKDGNASSYKLDDGKIYEWIDGANNWRTIPSCPGNVRMIAYHPAKPERLLVAVANTLYCVNPEKEEWSAIFTRGGGYIPKQVRFSTEKWWEAWMVVGAQNETEKPRTELWFSHNGGATWVIAQRLSIASDAVRLEPDTPEKYRIETLPLNDTEK